MPVCGCGEGAYGMMSTVDARRWNGGLGCGACTRATSANSAPAFLDARPLRVRPLRASLRRRSMSVVVGPLCVGVAAGVGDLGSVGWMSSGSLPGTLPGLKPSPKPKKPCTLPSTSK